MWCNIRENECENKCRLKVRALIREKLNSFLDARRSPSPSERKWIFEQWNKEVISPCDATLTCELRWLWEDLLSEFDSIQRRDDYMQGRLLNVTFVEGGTWTAYLQK